MFYVISSPRKRISSAFSLEDFIFTACLVLCLFIADKILASWLKQLDLVNNIITPTCESFPQHEMFCLKYSKKKKVLMVLKASTQTIML